MSIRTQLIVGAVGLALAFGAGWMVNGWRYVAQITSVERDQAKQLADAQSAARIEEQRRIVALGEIANDANTKALAAAADADAARVSAQRLRVELERIRSSAARNAAPADTGSTAGDPVGVLAVVLSEISDRSTALARFADQSRIAGLACEAAYDGVKDG